MKRVFIILIFGHCFSALFSQSLVEGFKNPPEEAKPRTWWHWTNSNITKEGITKDLEWMKRSGIGGMMLADVAAGQGQTVENKILFRSPEWFDAVRHTASEADRLGLEMTIFSSAGWSLTGGPWVKPGQAMKKLVWSEITVSGSQEFSGMLPSPPDVEGPIGNLTRSARPSPDENRFYRDFIVLAFPAPADESANLPVPVASTGTGQIDPSILLDDDLNSSVVIRSGKDKSKVWVQYGFDKPVTVRAITLANRAGIPVGTLSAGDDETVMRTLLVLPGAQLYRSGKVATYSFPQTTAKLFRLEFTGAPMRPNDVMAETPTKADTLYSFGAIRLHAAARINRWEDKAGFYHLFNYEPVASDEVAASSVIDPESVINITNFMSPDGTLKWKPPSKGSWTIMRFGYSLTGARNRPSVPAGSGLETDKLSREHIEAYIREYTSPLRKELGPLYGKVLRGMMLDSWEAGMQNWTDNMPAEFRQRRGYDLTPFLPALSGRVVGSSDVSDRVLWDFRRTLADMFAENHYKILTEYLNKQGIKTYGEASGVSLEILEDALLCKKYVDYPMGEFWYRALHPELMYYQDIRGAASASHVYGKTITAAESFTGGGFESPATLKGIGDYWFAQGVNRFVFHTSAHQPLDTKPGNTMVGSHINRNITWAEQASPYMTYLSRCSYMLQQGKFVADIAYLLNEGAPSTMPIWGTGLNPAPPEGYDYDYVNVDVLINRMNVTDGKIVLPDGMSYSVLVLPETGKMTLPVIHKLLELVKNGATIIGPRPERTPGYTGFPASETQLENIANELWGDLDGISRTRRIVGKGMVVWGTPVERVLQLKGIEPDILYYRSFDSELHWIHRKTDDADIYYIVNSSDRQVIRRLSLRTAASEAGVWDPVTGTIRQAEFTSSGNRTTILLDLAERESVFVVLNKGKAAAPPVMRLIPIQELPVPGPWQVNFPPGMGTPEKITLEGLASWTASEEPGVKYFSGTATYSKKFEIAKKFLESGDRIELDLGKVADIAEVTVNGNPLGTLWTEPFVADITGLLVKGMNTIEVKVTNQWTNRIVGDRNTEKKILNTNLFVRPVLSESGLLGPVVIKKYFRQRK